ncbi:MAG: hypothetical protein NT062_10060, partial [Proteobacteria bacterium]|nr:hypothetical protein [Pseudomonadota bacterium]
RLSARPPESRCCFEDNSMGDPRWDRLYAAEAARELRNQLADVAESIARHRAEATVPSVELADQVAGLMRIAHRLSSATIRIAIELPEAYADPITDEIKLIAVEDWPWRSRTIHA